MYYFTLDSFVLSVCFMSYLAPCISCGIRLVSHCSPFRVVLVNLELRHRRVNGRHTLSLEERILVNQAGGDYAFLKTQLVLQITLKASRV